MRHEVRTAFFMWDGSGLNVLIPKRRGPGFLKSPLYHSRVPELALIEYDEHIDCCGLDGYLCLEYGYTWGDAARAKIFARVMPRLAAYYHFEGWCEDEKRFWEALSHL